MRITRLTALLLLAIPGFAQADALYGNEMATGRSLPPTFGIGIDYFSLDQDYAIDQLTFAAPPGTLPPISGVSLIGVENEASHQDIKVDVWLLPFMNLFGVYGRIDGETTVDLTPVGLPLPPIGIDYDGDVYGVGLVLAFGGDRWFASLTGTLTDTDLGGGFKSSVETTAIQPRVGLFYGDKIDFWIGGYYIDTEEQHRGTINLDLGPLVGTIPIDFDVEVTQKRDFNPSVGVHAMLTNHWEATLEIGSGERDTVLANLTYRFE